MELTRTGLVFLFLFLVMIDCASGQNVGTSRSITAEMFDEAFIRGSGSPKDILVIVDVSVSVQEKDVQNIKNGLKSMLDLFCEGFGNNPTDNRLALMQFSSDPVLTHKLGSSQTIADLKAAVNRLYPMFGYTCTAKALAFARDAFRSENGGRFNSTTTSHTLLITDGMSNCGGDVRHASQQLQEVSTVWAVGINATENSEALTGLTSIVTTEDPRYLFTLDTFLDFENVMEAIKDKRQGDVCMVI
ncbi:collagen alpha-1(XXI) chain-like isoform X1 [Littorina saxatilis]|uniref:VWFA domain-containing protein n=1 Tax=Littorina saxatilis TaxID=31220 RepID=A0AAN9BIM9_9CAEN